MIAGLYRLATDLGAPLVALLLARRRARGKEDPIRFPERLGYAAAVRPEGRLAWLHAASVGESVALLPLIERLRAARPDWTLLLTTGTVTSARLMAERLPDSVIHQYVPVDRMAYARRFLDHWRPDLALWAESEFWPNLLGEIHRRRVPLVLINGRVSDRSLGRWRRWRFVIAEILGNFTLCLAQSAEDASRLAELGAARVEAPGNLKDAAPPLPADERRLAELVAAFGERPRWLAASTHPGEDAMAGRLHVRLKKNRPDLLTVIAPRHPERGPAIAAELRGQGLSVAQRSAGENATADTDIYLADTLGEMGLFYRLAPVVYVGKSLAPLGGQNPLEPARLGCALIHGPHMTNFKAIAKRLADAQASRVVRDEDELGAAVAELLADGAQARRLAEAARTVVEAEAGVLDRIMAALAPYLDPSHARP